MPGVGADLPKAVQPAGRVTESDVVLRSYILSAFGSVSFDVGINTNGVGRV